MHVLVCAITLNETECLLRGTNWIFNYNSD